MQSGFPGCPTACSKPAPETACVLLRFAQTTACPNITGCCLRDFWSFYWWLDKVCVWGGGGYQSMRWMTGGRLYI